MTLSAGGWLCKCIGTSNRRRKIECFYTIFERPSPSVNPDMEFHSTDRILVNNGKK